MRQDNREQLENILFQTCDQLTSRIEGRFQELEDKHRHEVINWFAKKKYPFGIVGWIKFGTMKENKIAQRIKMDDIMSHDTKRYRSSNPKISRKLTRSSCSTVCNVKEFRNFDAKTEN